jgi:GNAT superfamily N-acetyltransferase
MATDIQARNARVSDGKNGAVPTIRAILAADVEACGRAAYEAHRTVAAAHNYPPEHPSVEFSIGLIGNKLKDPNAWGILAEYDGRILGSVFLNLFPSTPVAVIGPLTVDPAAEGGVGRRLMQAALDEAHQRGIGQVRLVQSPSHLRSLALYVKLGFEVREPLLLVHGAPPAAAAIEGCVVRRATPEDTPACERLCIAVHGFARGFELRSAIEQKTATVVERAERISGYATAIGLRGYAVTEATDDLKALIAGASAILGPGFFVPIRNGALLRWLLDNGFRALWPATLMTKGPYQEPAGAFLPSIAF